MTGHGFRTGAGTLLAIVWIALGSEQVRLGQAGWDVVGCALLAFTFGAIALASARKL